MSDPFKDAVRAFFDKDTEEILTKDPHLHPIEISAEARAGARQAQEIYQSYIDVGFSHRESMELLKLQIEMAYKHS